MYGSAGGRHDPDTQESRPDTPRPQRLLPHGRGCRGRGADAEELSALIGRGRPKRGIFEGDLSEGELEIGQIAALIDDLPSAGDILRRLVAEYEAAREALRPL